MGYCCLSGGAWPTRDAMNVLTYMKYCASAAPDMRQVSDLGKDIAPAFPLVPTNPGYHKLREGRGLLLCEGSRLRDFSASCEVGGSPHAYDPPAVRRAGKNLGTIARSQR